MALDTAQSALGVPGGVSELRVRLWLGRVDELKTRLADAFSRWLHFSMRRSDGAAVTRAVAGVLAVTTGATALLGASLNSRTASMAVSPDPVSRPSVVAA